MKLPNMEPEHMTEKELEEEMAHLQMILKAGDATVKIANRMRELQRCLRTIQNAASGKGFD
jgi:hypothetical protein